MLSLLLAILLLNRLLNKLLKRTNWWHNIFVFTHQFDKEEKYDVVNVGSNPARFAFFYEDVMGQNWSTGTQGLDMDLLILKEYQNNLNKGAVVLLPIVAFSSVSGYLGTPKPLKYLSKFAKIVEMSDFDKKYNMKNVKKFMKYPLVYNAKAIKYLISDTAADTRLEITDSEMQLGEMKRDAKHWIEIWKKEFDIEDLNGELPQHLYEGRRKSVEMMSEMVSYLKEKGLKPIIITPPMSESLMEYFTTEVRETYIYSYIRSVQSIIDVPYLDYMDSEFKRNNYFFNALFLNLRGRKLFSQRVLKDLGVK